MPCHSETMWAVQDPVGNLAQAYHTIKFKFVFKDVVKCCLESTNYLFNMHYVPGTAGLNDEQFR